VALVVDIVLILAAAAAVFVHTMRAGGEETGGIVAVVYTGLFMVVVVPVFMIGFRLVFGDTPGRALLRLRPPASSVKAGRH
jgi:hypothetical protein